MMDLLLSNLQPNVRFLMVFQEKYESIPQGFILLEQE